MASKKKALSIPLTPKGKTKSKKTMKVVEPEPDPLFQPDVIDYRSRLKRKIDKEAPKQKFQSHAQSVYDFGQTVGIATLDVADTPDDDEIYESLDDDDLDYEQTSVSRQGRLFSGRASYRNVYTDPKRLEDKTWNTWEAFSAISGMSVKQLVQKAETGDLVLDSRALSRLRKRFTSMQKVYKRQYYMCGDHYIIPEQIPSWSEHCQHHGNLGQIEGNRKGDDALNQKVALFHGDITTLELDVIVNSISSHVTDSHEGVSKSIVKAASRLVYYELEAIWIILVGEVAATAGYLLPAKYIYHTSGPTKHDEDFERDLKNCYENCLAMMKQMGLRTLAFPCIATGAKKLNAKQAAMVALTTVKEWLQKNKDSVDKIVFSVYDIENWSCYQELMPAVFPPGQSTGVQGNLIPAEILRMDNKSIELYKRALSEGKEAVHSIRLMVVGHYGVGKTTLTKRLFGEDVDISKRESTEGIDVHVRRCKVSLDTGQWNIKDKDEKAEKVCHRLIKLLNNQKSEQETRENKENNIDSLNEAAMDALDGFNPTDENTVTADDSEKKGTDDLTEDTDPDSSMKEVIDLTETLTVKSVQPKEEHILNHLKELIEEIQQNSIDNSDSDAADLSVWDFAGQFVFYATHQVFLTRRAVYLLVTDISKHAQDLVEDDDCFTDSKGVNQWKISEFTEFWLNSIHEFCNSPNDDGPPVILVGTFADKLSPETKSATVDEFFYTLRSCLIDKATYAHLIDEDFVIDNSVNDTNIEKLRKQILDTASKQSYWGELIPAKWITLENILISLKDDGLKVLYKDKFISLNSTLPVPIDSEEELELFLRFHHESGNILHFSDEKLNDSIVLEPQWLIDAFKSLITAKMFCCRKPKIFKKWLQFDQSAILTNELVEAIWEKEENSIFHEYKDLLLDYLENLGFIAKPLQDQSKKEVADYYFAPCVLKTPPPDDLLVNDDCENRTSTSRLCFKTSSGFLPTAVFNKLLAVCVSKWPLSKWNAKPTIFCGCGIFDLRDNHRLCIYFFNHEIQIWLTKFSTSGEDPDRNVCSEVKTVVLDLLQNRYRLSSNIEIFVKCPTAVLRSSEDEFALIDLAHKSEVVCNCRPKQHVLRSKELTKYWQDTKLGHEDSVLTDKEINRIAHHIGIEYQSLGLELGLTQPDMEHIHLDCKTTVDRIRYVLLKWKSNVEDKATVETLKKAMETVGIDTVTALECVQKT